MAPGWEPSDDRPRSEPAREDGTTKRVEALLHDLPDRYRRVLELRFLERLSVAETATAMGISNGNARVLQYRALRRAALLGEASDG